MRAEIQRWIDQSNDDFDGAEYNFNASTINTSRTAFGSKAGNEFSYCSSTHKALQLTSFV